MKKSKDILLPLILILIMSISIKVYGYDNTVVNSKRGVNITETVGNVTSIAVWDQDYSVNYGSSMVMEDAYINVVLKLDEQARKNYNSYGTNTGNWKLTLVYDIKLYQTGSNNPTTLSNEEIFIFYMKQGDYEDISIKKYKDLNKFRKAQIFIRDIQLSELNPDGTIISTNSSLT